MQAQYGPTCGFFNILFVAQYFGMDVNFDDIVRLITEFRKEGKTHLGEIFDIEILYDAAKTFLKNEGIYVEVLPFKCNKPTESVIYILPVLGKKVLHYNTIFLDERKKVKFYTGRVKAESSLLWYKGLRHRMIKDTFDWEKYNRNRRNLSKKRRRKLDIAREQIAKGYEQSAETLLSYFRAEENRKEIIPVKARGYMLKIQKI